ncbi:MAG: glycosyltransferase family 39 protein, partial [Candidatus Korobacteraceae bacterium]
RPRWLLLATCLISFALFSARIDEGFIGADDGTLAHAAERVLHGERPQVDFYDNYTGALSYVDAVGLKLFGMRMQSLRWMLFLFFAAWVPAFWYLASRFASPPGASLLTLLAVLWSTPIYPAPLASWYNLYFATFGSAALFRYIEDRRAAWIFLAGVSAGVSFLFKIAGLYFLAAIVLFLVFDEQSSERAPECKSRSGWAYFALIALALGGFDCMLWGLIRSRASAASVYNFLLPAVVLSGLLMARAWQSHRGSDWLRLRRLGRQLLVLSSGFLAPVLFYLLPYVHAHALGRWFYGVLVIPTGRLQFTFYPSIHPVAAICCVPLVVLLLLSSRSGPVFNRRIAFVLVSGAAIALLFLCVRYSGFARWVWVSAAASIPVIVIAGAIRLWQGTLRREAASRFMLMLAVTALCSVIQFPFSVPMYFCYVAPLLVLSCAALSDTAGIRAHVPMTVPVGIFYLLFAAVILLPNQIYRRGMSLHTTRAEAFTLPRAAGMKGDAVQVDIYQQVVAEIARHAGTAPVWAGPDCAEFYFLAGRTNPTPVLWEALSGTDRDPRRILNWIERGGVQVVVINHTEPTPSGPLPALLEKELRRRFPYSRTIDVFEVRWAESALPESSPSESHTALLD